MKQHVFADNGPVPRRIKVREHERRLKPKDEPHGENMEGTEVEVKRPKRRRAIVMLDQNFPDNLYRVHAAFVGAGDWGLTDEELETLTGLGPNSARPRRIDLVKRQVLVDSGTKRKTRRGFGATVWRIK